MVVNAVRSGPSKFFHAPTRQVRLTVMNDSTLGEHKFVLLKDIKMHYVEAGDSSNPLMLFCHGFPECWYSWRHQIRHFSDRFRTVAIDMRGYCETDKPHSISDYTMEKLVGDVKDVIETLGHEKCILVGHDWGGAVCSAFAQIYPEMLSHLILMNIPHAAAFKQHVEKNPSQLLKSWYMFFFQLPTLPEIFLRSNDFSMIEEVFTQTAKGASRTPCSPEETEAYKFAMSQTRGATGPINYYRAALRYKPTYDINKKITVPTLRIWGEQDEYLESKMAELSGDYHTKHVLHYIPTGSHWVMLDEPEQVNNLIDSYLAELS